MTMNLDVVVRLVDQTGRSGRAAAATLEAVAKAGGKVKSAFNEQSSRNIRGVSSALTRLERAVPSTGSITRLERYGIVLRDVAVHSAGLGEAARNIDKVNRATVRMAANLKNIEAATRGIRALGKAMHEMPGGDKGFVSGANQQMAALIRMQGIAMSNMARLNAGGGGGRAGMGNGGSGSGGGGRRPPVPLYPVGPNGMPYVPLPGGPWGPRPIGPAGGGGGRRGMGGGGGAGGGTPPYVPYHLTVPYVHSREVLQGVWNQATSLQDAIVKMRFKGLSDSEIAGVQRKAQEIADMNKSTTPVANINAMMETRMALGGDLKEAMDIAPMMSKMSTVLAFQLGGDRAKAASEQMYEMIRAGELRGVINDPERRKKYFDDMISAAIYTDGRVMPKDYHKTNIYGRSATQGWSDDFAGARLPFLMQELKTGGNGGPAGVALQAFFRATSQAVMKKEALPFWRSLGMVDESKVVHGKPTPGAIKDDELARSDPDIFINNIREKLMKKGVVERGKLIQAFGALIGTGTGQMAFDIFGTQGERLKNMVETKKRVQNSEQMFTEINDTLSGNVNNLSAKMRELGGNIGTYAIPGLTKITEWSTKIVGVANTITGQDLPGGDQRKGAGGIGTGALVGSAGVLAAGTIALAQAANKWPMIGRALTFGGSLYAGGGIFSGVISRFVQGPMSRVFAAIARLGTPGFWQVAGAIGAYNTAKSLLGTTNGGKSLMHMDDYLAGPKLEEMRDVSLGNRIRRFIFGDFGDMVTAFTEPSHKAGTGVPIAGARATGGPVGRGLSYLVGERGPEIFTPGASGAISTHAATKLAMNRTTAGSSDDDGNTGREIRYMSFQLVSAIEGISRSLDRLRGSSTLPSDLGVDGGGGGGGGGLGGRRGFGARMGGSGDGVTLPDGSTGPRVGLGRMGSVRGRGFAKFDSKAPAIMGALMTKYGLTKEQAAGVVGNLGHESGGFTAYHEGGQAPGRGGVGWAQWTGPRRRAFERWTKAHGLDPTSDDASWRFLTEGDPETARAIAAVKRTRTAHEAMVAFEGSFERAGVKAYGSRDRFAARAMGMTPVAGVPDTSAAKASVPDALVDRARRQGEQGKSAQAGRERTAGTGSTTHVTNHIHVHAQPHHDEKKIASAVHERFNDAVRSQLSDGAFA